MRADEATAGTESSACEQRRVPRFLGCDHDRDSPDPHTGTARDAKERAADSRSTALLVSTDRSRHFYREPSVVEVRGVEPRSAEPFTPASPSAAISKHSVVGTLTASFPTSYPQSVFDIRSRTPDAAAYEATPAFRRGRHPPGGRAVTEGYSGSQCHLRFGISCWFPGC